MFPSTAETVFPTQTEGIWGEQKNYGFILPGSAGEFNQIWASSWYGNLTAKLKTKLARLVHTAMKVIGKSSYQTLQSIYEQSVLSQAQRIARDPSHILHSVYDLLPSGRRYRVPCCKLNRFKNSFVPTSIKLLNAA